jgi:trigger factor
MQVSVETTSSLERRLTVAVEEDRIADAVQSKLKDLTRTVKMKGFRKGKVPLKVVQQQYGSQVRQEVIGDVLQASFYEAVSQEKLRPAGMPTFDTKEMAPGKGLEYTATFEVYPEVAIADLSQQSIEKPVCEISDADVDNMIENIRNQNTAWETANRAAKEGDQINIDFKGMIDGEAFEGGEGKGMTVQIGQGRMIAGFEEGLKGAKSGDDLTLNLTFPDNYQAEHLAGKPVEFAIHVNTVEAPKLPEVDAEFAKKLGVSDGDLDKMRDEIRNNMQRELENKIKSRLKEGVMDKLLASHEIDVPAALIDNEAQALVNQMRQNLMSQGMGQQDLKLDPAMFSDQAERRVKLGLIMSEIVKQHDLQVDPEKVKAMVESIAAPYEHPEEVVKWYYADKRRLAEVESLVFEEQVVDWVMDQVKVEEKGIEFNELMNQKAGA